MIQSSSLERVRDEVEERVVVVVVVADVMEEQNRSRSVETTMIVGVGVEPAFVDVEIDIGDSAVVVVDVVYGALERLED